MKTAPNGSTPAIMVLKEKTFVLIPLIHTTKINHFYWPTNALNCIKLRG